MNDQPCSCSDVESSLAVVGAAGVPVARARAVGGASASQKAEEKVATVEVVGKKEI